MGVTSRPRRDDRVAPEPPSPGHRDLTDTFDTPTSGAIEVSKRPNPLQRLTNVVRYRELLGNLVRKELKVKYKNSVLGFVWSLLNPVLYLVVFSVVFQEVLRVQVPYFAIFFLSGLLAWNLFSTALSAGAGAIVGNAALVQKVWFPREVLPLASIGAALVHFCLQGVVLIAALGLFRRAPSLDYAIALLPAMLVLLVLLSALAVGLSAVNVYLRDTEHLLELVLLAWFWLSAIVYPYQLIAERLGRHEWLTVLNPMIPVIITFQRVLYNPSGTDTLPGHPLSWYLRNLGYVGAFSVALLFGALWLFGRLEDNFAEEI